MKLIKLFTFLLAIIFLLIPYHAAAASPELVDSFDIWTLEKLGYSDLSFPCAEDKETVSVEYMLPEDAAQGPENWYIIHLDFNIEFSDLSENGFCYVSALTNDKCCAQIEFETIKSDNSLTVDWNTLDLTNGTIDYSTSSLNIDVSFTNYLQFSGVIPDLNVLTFKLETFDNTKVKSLTILDSSGLEYSQLSPPELAMDVEPSSDTIETGDTFTLGFELDNTGGQPAKDVIVKADYPDDAFELIGEDSYSVASLETSLKNAFRFKALTQGEYKITIAVLTKSGIERPRTEIVVPVGDSSYSAPLSLPIVIAIIAVLTSVLVFLLIKRSRKT